MFSTRGVEDTGSDELDGGNSNQGMEAACFNALLDQPGGYEVVFCRKPKKVIHCLILFRLFREKLPSLSKASSGMLYLRAHGDTSIRRLPLEVSRRSLFDALQKSNGI